MKDDKGVLISMVNDGEPAQKAGIKAGDVIINFNGKKVNNVKALQRMVAEGAVASSAKVEVWRNKKLIKLNVKLADREKFDGIEKAEKDNNNPTVSDV